MSAPIRYGVENREYPEGQRFVGQELWIEYEDGVVEISRLRPARIVGTALYYVEPAAVSRAETTG